MQHACMFRFMYATYFMCVPLGSGGFLRHFRIRITVLPPDTFVRGGCRGIIFCHAARSANASASARVLYGTTRLDLHVPASIWL